MMYGSNASVRIYSRQMLAWTYTAKCRPCSTNYMTHESEKNTATVRLEYPRSGHIHEVVWNTKVVCDHNQRLPKRVKKDNKKAMAATPTGTSLTRTQEHSPIEYQTSSL